jgi:GT2 family glycosyltransferase
MSDSSRLYGVLVTFDRPRALEHTLDRLLAQTRPPDRLLLVDNGRAHPAGEVAGRYRARGLDITYLATDDNIGPAGGFALGMARALETAGDDDWIVLLDDDDPPYFDDALARAMEFARAQVARDEATGAVGISGGRFDRTRGRVLRVGDDEIHDAVAVDHITGGGLPTYRVAAVRRTGVMRADLFFGYEELEYGLRLDAAGFHLYADGEAWRERKTDKRDKGLLPPEEVSARRAATTNLRVGDTTWRRYYSLRNLILILRGSGYGFAALRVSLVRGVGKPFVNLFVSPREASRQLALGVRAVKDGWMGKTGRTVDPAGKR